MLIMWFFAYKSLPNLLFRVLCLPGDQSHPVCATDNKPSCVLHLLDWFIGSRGIPSLEQRPEFWVLQQASFSFKAAVTICSDFGAPKNKACHCFHCFLSICHEGMGPDSNDLRFLNVEF